MLKLIPKFKFLQKDKIPPNQKKKLLQNLTFLYGEEKAKKIYPSLERIIIKYLKKIKKSRKKFQKEYFSEKDVILIVYGDNIKSGKKPTLQTLSEFLENLKKYINTIHVLGLFLYSSDRGFSIVDFKKINPSFGNFSHLKQIEKNFKLLIDFVCNHISSRSDWFKKFSKGDEEYKDFFICFEKPPEKEKIECVFRPRTTPLLVKRNLAVGNKWIWRTFCYDQMDLNYQNPKVLLKMLDVFLFYVERGAKLIRLDAIGYIWKKLGTSCFLTKESHIFVQLLRNVLNIVSPDVLLVAEVNAGFKENLTYLGKKEKEAQLIYNFSLGPLVLYSFYKKNTQRLIKSLNLFDFNSKNKNVINILDCHDGISVVGAKDVLSKKEIKILEKETIKRGGKINYKKEGHKKTPYELNITWWSALENKNDSEILNIKKYIASRAIQLSLRGIPAIYFLGLFGIENCISCYKKTKKTRDINRKRFTENKIKKLLSNPNRRENKILNEILRLLKYRNKEKAFHPAGSQVPVFLNKKVFSTIRISPNKKEKILVLINVSKEKINLKINPEKIYVTKKELLNILDGTIYVCHKGKIDILLSPYQVLWLKY